MNITFIDLAMHRGGAELSLESLARELKKKHEITIIAPSGTKLNTETGFILLRGSRYFAQSKRGARALIAGIKILMLGMTSKCRNLIISNTFKAHIMAAGMKLTGRAKNWIIVERDVPENIVIRMIKQILHSGADRTVFISDFLRKQYPGSEGIVISNIIKPVECSEGEQSPYMLLFAGDLTYQKGLDRVIEVFDRLRKTDSQFELTVAGAPVAYSGQSPVKTRRGIHYEGYVQRSKLYSKAGFIILLNRKTESFSRVVYEAMKCGIVPVILKGNGMDDYTIDNVNALKFNRYMPDEICRRIISTIESGHYEKMRNNLGDAFEYEECINVGKHWLELIEQLSHIQT
ncbi:MAG: glycosyltransferase family 4 protein [candidate division WOR-3 bacterium]|nr:glycosyltransferase family 4 protein [candidate division WOR-3 bacterium]